MCTIEYNILIVFYQSFMQKNAYLNIINVNLSSFVNSPRGDCRKKKKIGTKSFRNIAICSCRSTIISKSIYYENWTYQIQNAIIFNTCGLVFELSLFLYCRNYLFLNVIIFAWKSLILCTHISQCTFDKLICSLIHQTLKKYTLIKYRWTWSQT